MIRVHSFRRLVLLLRAVWLGLSLLFVSPHGFAQNRPAPSTNFESDDPHPGKLAELRPALPQTLASVQNSIAAVGLFQGGPDTSLPETPDQYQSAFDLSPGDLVPSRMGGGVVLSVDVESGHVDILTAAHLLNPAVEFPSAPTVPTRIVVRLASPGLHFARIRALDPHSDLAVITVDLPHRRGNQITPARFTTSPRWACGDLALLCGNPAEFVRSGISDPSLATVSRTASMPDRWERSHWGGRLMDYLQQWDRLDLHGDSGSGNPVFSFRGELLGLTSGIAGEPGKLIPSGSAIYFSEHLQKLISDLLGGREVQYGDTHLELETIPAGVTGADGSPSPPYIRVTQVVRGSPAERAGIRSGDLILEFNQKPVERVSQILEETLFLPPGTEIELLVLQNKNSLPVRITFRLGKLDFPTRFRPVSTVDRWVWRGLSLDFPVPLPAGSANSSGPLLPTGVRIIKVQEGSAGAIAGLKPGQLIAKVGEQPVETPEEFESALRYWTGLVPLTLDDGREIFIEEIDPPSRPID